MGGRVKQNTKHILWDKKLWKEQHKLQLQPSKDAS